jgi:hypothetical protein
MEAGKGHIKRVNLEMTGGFTGAAGKQAITLDLGQLPQAKSAELQSGLDSIPEAAWGSSFFAPHPKPWDFHHVLKVEDDQGVTRQVEFHRGQGPPELTGMVDKITELHSGGQVV